MKDYYTREWYRHQGPPALRPLGNQRHNFLRRGILIKAVGLGAMGLLFGRTAFFLIGVYAGIYIDQNYKIVRVDNPKDLASKGKEYLGKFKKDDDSTSKSPKDDK